MFMNFNLVVKIVSEEFFFFYLVAFIITTIQFNNQYKTCNNKGKKITFDIQINRKRRFGKKG